MGWFQDGLRYIYKRNCAGLDHACGTNNTNNLELKMRQKTSPTKS